MTFREMGRVESVSWSRWFVGIGFGWLMIYQEVRGDECEVSDRGLDDGRLVSGPGWRCGNGGGACGDAWRG